MSESEKTCPLRRIAAAILSLPLLTHPEYAYCLAEKCAWYIGGKSNGRCAVVEIALWMPSEVERS